MRHNAHLVCLWAPPALGLAGALLWAACLTSFSLSKLRASALGLCALQHYRVRYLWLRHSALFAFRAGLVSLRRLLLGLLIAQYYQFELCCAHLIPRISLWHVYMRLAVG